MSKPFLIIQLRPEDEVADEELRAIIEHGGLSEGEVRRVRAERDGLPSISLDELSGIIVGGSPFDVSTPASQKSAIQKRVEAGFCELLGEIDERDFPFLGCCSGNGLLGAYCGASISRRFGEPVGAARVELTDAGRKDPLLRGLPGSFTVLLGHKEACDAAPPRVTLLATGEHCPVQMFRLKTNIYATQFHPEADGPGFELRVRIYRHHGYFPPEDAPRLIEAVTAQAVPESNEILRRFVARYRS
ncbi:MAG: glutamine amidotransferase [Halieaceae bacterium]|jgi:GMP synthase (glutamine-hydrolysing)|nr:glutamine amidotransferase [Halieaceae bacterium]